MIVSVVVAEIVMQNIEEQGPSTHYPSGYVTLMILTRQYTKTKLKNSTNALINKQNANIQFTKEIVENGKIPQFSRLLFYT